MALLGTTAVGFAGWQKERDRSAALEAQLAQLRKEEKRSAVVRSVSKQLGDIAYQQKEISDEQREEAIQQKRVADEMRLRSEVERQNALVAQNKAMASEQQAQEARQQAEQERQMAEHQRIQAEFSKRVTDTLSYVALGRSLGSLSSVQARLGNKELSDLLAYSSHLFVNRYKGDLFYPTVFQSLTTASQSMHTWPRHNGLLTALASMPGDDDRVVTASTYGEIAIHKRQGDQLLSTTLLSDKDYDFRDIFIDEASANGQSATIYAVSRSGHLAIIENDVPRVMPIQYLDYPMGITNIDDNTLLLTGDRGIAVYDKRRKIIVGTRELDFKLTALSRYDYKPILFDDRGRQHIVNDINDFQTSDCPVPGRVTAFASSKQSKKMVYGMSDGTIYLIDENGTVTKLQGHLSRISKLKINNTRLYSSSYDGTMKFWNTASAKIEPMTLISDDSWIMNFIFDSSKQFAWIGDQNGNLSVAMMSVPMMVDLIRNNLKRDFTTEEWNYYIGKNVPYESFLNGKEARP